MSWLVSKNLTYLAVSGGCGNSKYGAEHDDHGGCEIHGESKRRSQPTDFCADSLYHVLTVEHQSQRDANATPQ